MDVREKVEMNVKTGMEKIASVCAHVFGFSELLLRIVRSSRTSGVVFGDFVTAIIM